MKSRKRGWCLFLLLIVSACSMEASGAVASFEEQASDELGVNVFIPEFPNFPITSAEIISTPLSSNKILLVMYSDDKGELQSEEYIARHEDNADSEVLYGIYGEEPHQFSITFSTFTRMSGDGAGETKQIDGTEVQYLEADSGGNEFLLAYFNAAKGSYSVEFALNEKLTREQAFEIIAAIIAGMDR